MTLQDIIEKLKRYPIPTSCAAIALVCFLAFYLRLNYITDLEIRQDDVTRQAAQVELNINNGTTLAEHLEKMTAYVAELDGRLIKPSELATNLKYFYEIEASTHVAIADLRQNPPPATKGPQKDQLAGVSYSVLFSGRFDQVISCLNELENGRHFYRLNNFSLQRGGAREGASSTLTMSLSLELLGLP